MAQTLKFGNKTWATKVGSTLAYNDENDNYKPLPFNFTRSTSATRVNKEGLIEVVTNDRPRIDYTDTSDGVLLLENAATNSLLYSEDFSQWDKNSDNALSVTINSTISPNGSINADKIEKVSSGFSYIRKTYNAGVGVLSVFVKKGNYRYIGIRNNQSSAPSYSVFDFDTESFTKTLSNHTTSFVKYPNGWYRIIDYVSVNNLSPYRGFALTNVDGDEISSNIPINSYVYVWGAQGELNQTVASSYIPTQGSAVTRVAETASGSGNSEVLNSSEGVLFANIAANADDSTNRVITLSDGTTSNRVQVYFNTSNQIVGGISASGSGQADITYTIDIKLFLKIAFKYKANDFALWVNGVKVGEDLIGIVPTGLNVLNFDNVNSTLPFYGKTKEIGYYNTILTDLELETLTSYKSWTSMVNELNLNIIYNG